MFVSKKKFEKLRSECDSWRATAEARGGALKDVERTLDMYKRGAREYINQILQEKEDLITEGAKLADQLAELRKAPEVKGVRVWIGGDPPFYKEGVTKVRVIESDPREMLISIGEKRGDRYFEMAQHTQVTGWELVPAEPVAETKEMRRK